MVPSTVIFIPKWVLQSFLMLIALLGACRKESGSSVTFISTEDEYMAAADSLSDRQLSIYAPGVSSKERNRMLLDLTQESLRLACQYAATSPSALDIVVRNAFMIPREELLKVYSSLTPGMQKTHLGKAIKKHIGKKELLAGDPLPHFKGIGLDGEPFDWSVVEGKRVLLIYEGWGWIKRSTHLWFKDLLAATDRDSLAVVAYVYANSEAYLHQRVKAFQLEPYLVISDLKGKEGPLDKQLGVKGIPTYYYTDSQGRIRNIIAGFDSQMFTYYTGLSPQWGENLTE